MGANAIFLCYKGQFMSGVASIFGTVPTAMFRDDYFVFIAEMRDEYTELSIYTDILRPAEFTYTVYLITRFNAPMIKNTWPWYDTVTKEPRRVFAQNIISTYEKQYSFWTEWCPCEPNIDEYNPLLNDLESKPTKMIENKDELKSDGK